MAQQRNTPSHSGNMGNKTKYAGLRPKAAEDAARFAGINAKVLGLAIDAIVGAGDAVMLSRTSDGGAICVCLYDGSKNPVKLYPTSQGELDELMERLADGT